VADVAAREEVLARELAWLRRRHQELSLLYETIRDLGGTLSLREVLDRLLGRVLAHLDAEIGSVLLVGRDSRLRIAVARGLPPDVVERTCLRLGEGISGSVATRGQALLVRDIERDPHFARRNHERYYTRSLISAPLVHLSRPCGVVNVNNKRSRAPFEETDLELVEAIAGHAGAALANADRYERTLEQARRDSLTGLANHGTLWTTLDTECQRARRYGRPLAFVMIDVDHFKRFNDRHGHPAGDRALTQVARILESGCRAHDVVGRYGGEEFAAILPETPLEGARAFAEKIRGAVACAGFGEDGRESLTVSAGAAVCEGDAADARILVRCADDRLYRAKASGRDRVCTDDD